MPLNDLLTKSPYLLFLSNGVSAYPHNAPSFLQPPQRGWSQSVPSVFNHIHGVIFLPHFFCLHFHRVSEYFFVWMMVVVAFFLLVFFCTCFPSAPSQTGCLAILSLSLGCSSSLSPSTSQFSLDGLGLCGLLWHDLLVELHNLLFILRFDGI